jgi:hypothetical protein
MVSPATYDSIPKKLGQCKPMSLPKSTANFFNILENKITGGETTDSILKSYPYLEKEDIIEVCNMLHLLPMNKWLNLPDEISFRYACFSIIS